MMTDQTRNFFWPFLLGITIALGLASAGYLVARGITHFRLSGRYVTVKGLAEKEVMSDMAIWKIRFKASGNELGKTNDKITNDLKVIMNFLKNNGLAEDSIELSAPRVIDLFAREYGPEKPSPNRYIIEASITVRSTEVDKVKRASGKSIELIQHGIALDEGSYGANPSYIFTKLNDIRPAMLAEAAKSARILAEQFAADSLSTVGPIRQANQGTFTIGSIAQSDHDSGDEKLTIKKKVRVVSTIDYFLID
jgi:hypothetical protein